MPRRLASLLLVALAAPAFAEVTPLDVERAAETARRGATSVASGQPAAFFETLDVDGILSRSRQIGVARWLELSEPQRNRLRSLVREGFLRELLPTEATGRGQIAWTTARPEGQDGVSVWIGLDYPRNRQLKTTWRLARHRSDWRITDVVLSDPGISLARAALRGLPQNLLRPRPRGPAAWEEALPRLTGISIIALIVAAFWRRARPHRHILLLTALGPAFVFALDGALAVRAALRERWSLPESFPAEPWRTASRAALSAIDVGAREQARQHAESAVARGADAGPLAYSLGVADSAAQDAAAARRQFASALSAIPPAPGAARELAALDLNEGHAEAARRRLRDYLRDSGPDPSALTLLAVSELSVGNRAEAVEAIDAARQIVGGGLRGAELEAQIRARAGDAAGAVSALRPIDAAGLLDRAALRKDPAYVEIATEPAWESFLAEKPKT